jgi:hypothetical protein
MHREVFVNLAAVTMVVASSVVSAGQGVRRSQPISSVLREPLPPEELTCAQTDDAITIEGPTFSYTVRRASGAIASFRVVRDGEPVIESTGPADVEVNTHRLTSAATAGKTDVEYQGQDKVVLRSEGVLKDGGASSLSYATRWTFFNDGVAVCEVRLRPERDLSLRDCAWRVPVRGRFGQYLHKTRDDNGVNAAMAKLPGAGEAARFTTLTSCLQVFSADAALAAFTDRGSTRVSADLDSAEIEVDESAPGRASLTLCQYVVRVKPEAEAYVVKGGSEFMFRVGICVAPNRLPHRRTHDLRMFTWIGDAKYPYPTDEEIREAARLGYTIFQLHRAGTPGEPRPPAGEFERVLRTVHEAGMLYLWEENADLLYGIAPGVVEMKAQNKWPLWQGFNYGGRYTASMDPYCDLVATCLASPNGLAEYRLQYLGRMMDRYAVDGIYLDDNLAYANCTLWKEHGHPQPVYDCLIELHEMNWRRRELLRTRCPHAVLISHNTNALILPVICDFDAHLYGEGYGFGSLETYWDYFGMIKSLNAQNQIWPGSSDKSRCAASVAYNYDLLTGGGQFEYCDWRLFPKKFPHGEGVTATESLYVKTYTLAQYYFGVYESTPFIFANSAEIFSSSTAQTYASVYANRLWRDYLIPVANMAGKSLTTSLTIHQPERLGLAPDAPYVVYDVQARMVSTAKGAALAKCFAEMAIPKGSLKLFYVRPLPKDGVGHLWGGKRISEEARADRLVVEIQAPAGLDDVVVFDAAGHGVKAVTVDGKPAEFFFDPAKRLVHGNVTFTTQSVKLEVIFSSNGHNGLAEKSLGPDKLAQECLSRIAD